MHAGSFDVLGPRDESGMPKMVIPARTHHDAIECRPIDITVVPDGWNGVDAVVAKCIHEQAIISGERR